MIKKNIGNLILLTHCACIIIIKNQIYLIINFIKFNIIEINKNMEKYRNYCLTLITL